MKKSKYNPKDEHDIVVQMAFNKLDKSNIVLLPNFSKLSYATNLRSKKPDIIVYLRDKVEENIQEYTINQGNLKRKETTYIYEIEVAESINDNSIAKWKEFYNSCELFYLIVPKYFKEKVDELCAINNIIAIFLTYEINEEGKIDSIEGL